MTQMQGIVSILRSDNPEKTSLRRTLSADMSSKRWKVDNGLPRMKKIASSAQITIDSSESDEEESEVVGKGDRNPSRMDIWTAIMSQKKEDNSSKLPPPYVHPLVKKSASSLSEKSLKVCTESLGSETGSETFSLTPSSDKCDNNDQQQEEERVCSDKVVKFACMTNKKSQQARNSFPPPIQSLAATCTDGQSVKVHSRRVDGRLVLEAVSIQQQKYFETQRQDGRFLLTLINDPEEPTSDGHAHDDNYIDEKEESEIEMINLNVNLNIKEMEFLNYRPIKSAWSAAATPVITEQNQKSLVRIKRILERDNENPWWSRKLNTKEEKMKTKLEVVEEEAPITKKSPPPPRASTRGGMGRPPLPPPSAVTVNSYEYFWRAKPTSVASVMMTQHRPPTKTKELFLLRGNKADCFLPSLKGCKEPRRSIMMWEPFCIATSS